MGDRKTILGLVAAGVVLAPAVALAQAAYDYQVINYPGVSFTNLFAINDHGVAVGNGSDGAGNNYPFLYDIDTGTLTDVANVAGYDRTAIIGISDSGLLVGDVDLDLDQTRNGLIRDLQGADTVFSHPDALFVTEARGVNNQGLVSGSRDSAERPGEYAFAFIYNPTKGTFIDFAESISTLAHGMNSQGDVVGNAVFFSFDGPEDPCPDLPGDPFFRLYGWLRTADGSLTYFLVNGEPTRARGINDRGQITGWVRDFSGGPSDKGFVIEGKEFAGATCVAVTVATEDLLVVSGFGDNTSIYPEGITNSGNVVGVVRDRDAGSDSGFIATPR